jgi:hypothetical protein
MEGLPCAGSHKVGERIVGDGELGVRGSIGIGLFSGDVVELRVVQRSRSYDRFWVDSRL